MPGQDFTPLVSVEDTLAGEPFCFCTAGWSPSARETAKRNKSHPNTVAVDTLRAASRRWESGFQVLIQVVSVRKKEPSGETRVSSKYGDSTHPSTGSGRR